MLKGLFVTATDTNVGKTVVSAALMHRYREELPLAFWKPIQTGIEIDDDTDTVRKLGECRAHEIFDRGVRLPRPLSPHLSAKLAEQQINLDELILQFEREDQTQQAQATKKHWIIEGAGGLFVPINGREMMIDLIEQLALPVLIVSRSTLGTINHTLMTISVLRSRARKIAGVVMVGERNPENRAAIEHYGTVQVIAEMPLFPELNAEVLKDWTAQQFDREGVLKEAFL